MNEQYLKRRWRSAENRAAQHRGCELTKEACRQLSLFPNVLEVAELLAIGSERKTFYRIWIEENVGLYTVTKESGSYGHVLNRRSWKVENLEEAKSFVARKIKEKTNPYRKSPRKYSIQRIR